MKDEPGTHADKLRYLFSKVEKEFAEGMTLTKCLQCGCMKEELEQTLALPQAPDELKLGLYFLWKA